MPSTSLRRVASRRHAATAAAAQDPKLEESAFAVAAVGGKTAGAAEGNSPEPQAAAAAKAPDEGGWVPPAAQLLDGATGLVCGIRRSTGFEPTGALELEGEVDQFGHKEEVQVSLDNYPSNPTYTLLAIACRDRKGLVYDIMRCLHDVGIRVAYGRVSTAAEFAGGLGSGGLRQGSGGSGVCSMDLFVQEADGTRVSDPDLQRELVELVRCALALPLRISIRDVFDATCTELLVTAYLDSGSRGRPRVTYDVTAALNALQLCVFMADVFYDSDLSADGSITMPRAATGLARSAVDPRQRLGSSNALSLASVAASARAGSGAGGAFRIARITGGSHGPRGVGQRPQELHRFLVTFPDGKPLQTEAQKRYVYEHVRSYVMGTNAHTQRAS